MVHRAGIEPTCNHSVRCVAPNRSKVGCESTSAVPLRASSACCCTAMGCVFGVGICPLRLLPPKWRAFRVSLFSVRPLRPALPRGSLGLPSTCMRPQFVGLALRCVACVFATTLFDLRVGPFWHPAVLFCARFSNPYRQRTITMHPFCNLRKKKQPCKTRYI